MLNPSLVIESGVLKGASTWIIEKAAPKAKIVSIDPILDNIEYFSPNATYTTEDFSTLSIEPCSGPIVCFFDDHIDAYERVMQANGRGIKHLIFDDNYPPGYDDSLEPHLTLRDCFEMRQHEDKAAELKKVIKQYLITPQIIGKTAENFVQAEVSSIIWRQLFVDSMPHIWKELHEIDPKEGMNLPSIWQGLEDAPKEMEIFSRDSIWYRWMTYVELY